MTTPVDNAALAKTLIDLAPQFGFQAAGVAPIDPHEDVEYLHAWLAQDFHGEMHYMARNADLRRDVSALVPDALSVISLRMDYKTESMDEAFALLDHANKAYISRYALGRDYHKLIRKRLQHYANAAKELIGEFGYRVFTDSAPILEKALARDAGLGWIGKHTLVLSRDAGSYYFLAELVTDLPLDTTPTPPKSHCGSCSACIDICPTAAIVAPYQLDARRCISYLTIEHRGPIPEEFRKPMGNRIFGCDDCQLVCPWNRYARLSDETDFQPRYSLDDVSLLDLFAWTKDEFEERLAGMAIRRTGFDGWRRNIAVALGNAAYDPAIVTALYAALPSATPLLREHLEWALQQQDQNRAPNPVSAG